MLKNLRSELDFNNYFKIRFDYEDFVITNLTFELIHIT